MAISETQAKEEELRVGENLPQIPEHTIVSTGTVGIPNVDVPVSTLARIRVYQQTFEDGTTDTTAVNCTQTVQSEEVYSGTYSLRVDVPANTTAYIETPSRPVSPYQRVTFTYTHKEDANITDVRLVVVWRRPAGGIITTDEFTLTPSTTWEVDGRTVTAPKKADSMTLRMQVTAGSAGGTFYLDDITIDLVGQIFRVDGEGNTLVAITEDQLPLPVTGIAGVGAVESVSISSGIIDLVREVGSGRVEISNIPLPVTGAITVEKVSISSGMIDLVRVLETGQVGILNFPSEYPLPASQIATLTTTGTVKVTEMADKERYVTSGKVEIANVPLPVTGVTAVESVAINSGVIDLVRQIGSGKIEITNLPTEYPLPSSQLATLTTTGRVEIANVPLPTTGTVSVTNLPTEYPLPASQVADLKMITTGQIGVLNFPTEYPLPSSQIATLTTTGTVRVTEVADKERHITSGYVEVSNVPLPVTGAISIESVSVSSGIIDLVRELGSGRVEIINIPLPVTGAISVEQVSISSGVIDLVRELGSGKVEVTNVPLPVTGVAGVPGILTSENYGLDLTTAQSVTLDLGTDGRSIIEVVMCATGSTTNVYIDSSADNTHWYTVDYQSGVYFFHAGYRNAFRYVRVRTDAQSTGLVDIVITAVR